MNMYRPSVYIIWFGKGLGPTGHSTKVLVGPSKGTTEDLNQKMKIEFEVVAGVFGFTATGAHCWNSMAQL
jgi:hypothetical protein